jgi:hypothetical protein
LLLALAATAAAGCAGSGAGGEGSPLPAGQTSLGYRAPLSLTSRLPRAAIEQRPWDFHGMEGQVLVTEHFELYTTLESWEMVRGLPAFYEHCLEQYTTALAALPAPSERLRSFIFQDSRQWRNKTREILPDQADAFMTLGRGGFTTRGTSVLYYIGTRDTFAIAAHEGWHQYTQRTFKHPLPIWLEEGIATYMEAIPSDPIRATMEPWHNRERRGALQAAVREGRLIPLSDLLRRSPQAYLNTGKGQLLVYYAQVWALTLFLAEGEGGKYSDGLQRLLRDAASGRISGRLTQSRVTGVTRRGNMIRQMRSGPAVLLTYFNDDLSALAAEYERFLSRMAGERDRRPVS